MRDLKRKKPPAPLEFADEPTIRQWVATNVQRRYRKETIATGLSLATAGGRPGDVSTGLASAAAEARLRYLATSALVLGILSAVIAVSVGGLSILTVIFTALSGERGIKSQTRRGQAIAGLLLAGLAIAIFILSLVRGHGFAGT
jgi:hypothetical protein